MSHGHPPGGQPWDRQPPPAGGYAPPPVGPPPAGTGLATTSMVLGIVSLCGTCVTGIPAMICGFVALSKGTPARGQAITGLVLGGVGTLLLFPGLILAVVYPAYAKYDEAKKRFLDSNSLKQVGFAFHNSHSDSFRLPAADGPVSWRVHLLPYIEQNSLHKQFNLKQPWDAGANKLLADIRVGTYSSQLDPPPDARTHLRVFTGRDTLYPPTGPLSFGRVTDGLSNTILSVETTEAVPWPAPREVSYSPTTPLPALGHKDRASFLLLMGDGSVRAVKKGVNEATLRPAITANGGEVVNFDW